MNSGPTGSTIVAERIRSISAMADESMQQPASSAIGASWSGMRAPKRDRRVLSVESPAQGKMDDAPSVIGLRELVEPFDRPKVLLKSRRAELWVYLSQVVPRKLRLRRLAAGEQTPAHRPVGKRDDIFVAAISGVRPLHAQTDCRATAPFAPAQPCGRPRSAPD
jgi:hypothetical protein